MNANREILEDHLDKCEAQLRSFKSYIKELTDKTTKHGTETAHFEQDLFEAEHNVKYYEGEIARVKKELADLDKRPPAPNGGNTVAPQTLKLDIGSLILASISFIAGALVGYWLGLGGNSENAE